MCREREPEDQEKVSDEAKERDPPGGGRKHLTKRNLLPRHASAGASGQEH